MESSENGDVSEIPDESDLSTVSAHLSPSSSLSSSFEFRRMMKPPNKRKYDDEIDALMKQIRPKEIELKSLGVRNSDAIATELRATRQEKEAIISRRKKVDENLKIFSQDLAKKMSSLAVIESNLHYKTEAKIDDSIRKLEWQLKIQNFKVSEERKIVTEIDKLKRSKKTLGQYFIVKKEVDEIRDSQKRMRSEREKCYQMVNSLKDKEEEVKRSNMEKKAQAGELKRDIDEMFERKRALLAEYKQSEQDYTKMKQQMRNIQRKESFKKREEDRRAKEEAWRKELEQFQAQKEPFEDEKNLCNTLISYLQPYNCSIETLPSPREETVELPSAAALAPGIADSLDDGMFVLLKKSKEEEPDYSITNRRANRRSRKGRKISTTKHLSHTPQIIAQFAALNLAVPSTMAEVPASLEQLQARKCDYEEHTQEGAVCMSILHLRGSFSSSGSQSSLDSPLRERNNTWGFVEVPPAISETQAPSDAGESGFHDMSRQASKTESSESTADTQLNDRALEELITECAGSEHTSSSSDTIILDEVQHGQDTAVSVYQSTDVFTTNENQSGQSDSGQQNTTYASVLKSPRDSSFEWQQVLPPVVDNPKEATKGDDSEPNQLTGNKSSSSSVLRPSLVGVENSKTTLLKYEKSDMKIIVTDCSESAVANQQENKVKDKFDVAASSSKVSSDDRYCDKTDNNSCVLVADNVSDVGYISGANSEVNLQAVMSAADS